MKHISSPLANIKDHYDAVVIGSGYGGAIAASRLARMGFSVCLLERGREILPGEFPDTEVENALEMQFNTRIGHTGSRTGLFEYHLDDAMAALVGCGLGGTSLINANVSLRLDRRVFDDPIWPQAYRNDVDGLLDSCYTIAEKMLGANPYPDTFPQLSKMAAMERSAKAMNATFTRVPLNVSFHHKVNDAGVEQPACTMCGDCMSGCNYGSKNTTAMNYLPDAVFHGAEIYTQASVEQIERQNQRWVVHFEPVKSGSTLFGGPTQAVSADIVVVGAGTYGSTKVLMQSRDAGLSLSNKLGDNYSGNGDVGGFAYNCDVEISAIGVGQHLDAIKGQVGPTITSAIDLRDTADFEEGMIIEEGTLYSAVAVAAAKVMATSAALGGIDTDSGWADTVAEKTRELETLLRGPYHGAAQNSQVYLVMAHDGFDGKLTLQDGRIRVDWPSLGNREFIRNINEKLLDATRALGGTFIENPMWAHLPTRNMVTAHPLGGCVMGETAAEGVINHKGQVFSGQTGSDVHEGLYVTCGAALPRSVGVNPLLTISASAERAMHYLAQDYDKTIDYSPNPATRMLDKKTDAVGIQFTETMGGFFAFGAADFDEGWDKGKTEESPFRFILTILVEDVEKMINDPDYTSHMTGTVVAPALSSEPLTVTEGDFNLAVTDPNDPAKLRRMKYNMKLTDQDGRCYYFHGFKLVRGEKHGLDLWPDTTTLYITVYDGESRDAPELGKGKLRIYPVDFAKQIATFRVTNALSAVERARVTAKFGSFFAGTLYDVYGGYFGRQSLFDPEAPPRKKRALRAPAPEVHPFETQDGLTLRLTRYQGGSKGPVLLVHGMGVSSFAFTLDTIDTNMVEYLTAQGYDVWLVDLRCSIALPYADQPSTADEIALYDLPAAVDKVRAVTGAADIQAVVHCYGAIAFHMAMLGGMQGVRSAVSSQVGAHINVIKSNKFKSMVYLPDLMARVGIKSLTMHTDASDGWLDRIYNRALGFNPTIEGEELCDNPVCHRVTFLYAPLYEHDQLNNATHQVVHELFGVASIENFQHLTKMTRAGMLVDKEGKDSYLPHVERLALPIAYIHGAENQTWLPAATERTYSWLVENNGSHLYSRHIIPLYGHIDCIFGKDAARDVFPLILQHLEKTAVVEA